MKGKCVPNWLRKQAMIQQIILVMLTNNFTQSFTKIAKFCWKEGVGLEITTQSWRRFRTSDGFFGVFKRKFACYSAPNIVPNDEEQFQKYNISNPARTELQITSKSQKLP